MSAATPTAMRSPLRHRPFALYWLSRGCSGFAYHMQGVAVGWQLYALTGDPLDLGLVGLAQFLPVLVLNLAVGQIADRFDRRLILAICRAVEGVASLILATGTMGGWIGRESILAVMALVAAARAFEEPTVAALLPDLVPRVLISRAAALAAAIMQVAKIAGPALGGLLYVFGPAVVHEVSALLFLFGALSIGLVRVERGVRVPVPFSLATLFSGLDFVRRQPVILGALLLDMFVVLLGGATALLPIYARDILDTGPWGLGLLRAAPAIGALTLSTLLARHALKRRVGALMFGSTIVFGLATVVFGLSTSLWLSLAALVVLGAADIVSVVIRVTLVQTQTPDHLRGRVSAANSMFTTTSNRLGDFESGLAAALLGTVPAVLLGGLGTVAVALLWMLLFPALRRADTLD